MMHAHLELLANISRSSIGRNVRLGIGRLRSLTPTTLTKSRPRSAPSSKSSASSSSSSSAKDPRPSCTLLDCPGSGGTGPATGFRLGGLFSPPTRMLFLLGFPFHGSAVHVGWLVFRGDTCPCPEGVSEVSSC